VCAQGDVAENRSDLLRYARRSLLVCLFCSLASLFCLYSRGLVAEGRFDLLRCASRSLLPLQ